MANWKLKKEDGSEYGPVTLEELAQWARSGRVAPEDAVSEDGLNWKPAPALAELAMDYTVTLTDGSDYGPLTLEAVFNLLEEGYIELSAPVSHRSGERTAPFREWLTAHSPTENIAPPAAADTHEEWERERAAWAEERDRLEQRMQDQTREIAHWKQLYEQANEALQTVRRRAAETRQQPAPPVETAKQSDKPRRSAVKTTPQNYSTSYIYASRHRMDHSDKLKENGSRE